MTHQKNCFKINCILAYILKTVQTKELRYYHSRYHNAQMLDTALLISNRKDLMNFLNVAKLVQCSSKLYSETMRLNIWENHLSLIVDFEHYCNMYQCIHCWKL